MTDNIAAVELIDISLEMGNFPDTGKMKMAFESGQSWALFVEGNDCFLEYKPPGFQEPFWIAHCDSRFEKATVHFGRMMTVREEVNPPVLNPLFYPLDQLLLMFMLIRRNGALIHAAGFSLMGNGFAFPGKSGAGKSTLSRLFLGSKGVAMLSDDRVVIRRIEDELKIYGTPWAGDAGIAENREFPLKGIFFICHGDKNSIKELNHKEALVRLMPVTSIPWYDDDAVSRMLFFCEDIAMNVPAYELYFKPDIEAVDFLKGFILKYES